MEFLIAALSIGFVGSFHCVGMCGPIALALPLGGQSAVKRISGMVLYNLGRVVTYSVLGMVFGLLGRGFIIGGYQQALSVSLGIIILCGLLLPAKITAGWNMTKVILPMISKVKSLLGSLLKQKTLGALFLIGILNGLLPCGLVYLAVAGAIATGSVIKGGLFMSFFGFGTIPAMIFVSMAANVITPGIRMYMRKAVPLFIGVMACCLILRGMNLGIPYVSPQLSKTDCTKHSCCNKK
jgi:hypothetical protein